VGVDVVSCVLNTKAVARLPLRQIGFLVYAGLRKLFYLCKSEVSAIQGHPRSLILVPIENAY